MAGPSGTLQIDFRAAIDDARKQLVVELQAQSEAVMGLTAISNHNQAHNVSYRATFGSLPSAINRLVEEAQKFTISQRVLESLLFDEIKLREDQIQPAYTKTFTWIFEDDTTSFKRWLTSSDGIFWVSGKAGSGKSTLMKFLANHETTRALLCQWSGSETLVVASYYFWNAGHDAQKSQLGLMKSLLYQIFRQCPDLIPPAWSSRFDSGSLADNKFDSWSRQDLSDAVDSIIARGSLTSRFCFFVDGLDEYADAQAGDHYALIQYLDHLTRSPCVKICVSSRPWTVFKDRYGQHDNLKFVLQDLTSEDMLKYAQGLLHEDERFQRLASRDPKALLLAAQIRDKAEGVFLWVFLVTRSLKRGLSEKDNTRELERRLAQTPSDLIDFFRSILKNIDDNYKNYTMRALQLVAYSRSIRLGAFQYIPQEVEDQNYAIRQEITFDEPTVDMRGWTSPATLDVEAKVNKWCRDLLEVQHDEIERKNGLISVPEGHVTPLHRTVSDFLRSSEMEDVFKQYSVCIPSPAKALCRMHLAYTKSCCSMMQGDSQYGPGGNDKVLFWAKVSELDDETTPFDILNELKRTILAFEASGKDAHSFPPSCLRLAVERNLLLYIDHTADRDVLADSGILWEALLEIDQLWDPDNPHFPGFPMVAKLLDRGCSPNDIWTEDGTKNESPWQKLMRRSYENKQYGDDVSQRQVPQRAEKARIVELLLKHGADPDATFESRDSTGGIRLGHAREFLMIVFDGDRTKVDALQKEARKVRLAAAGKKPGLLARFIGWST